MSVFAGSSVVLAMMRVFKSFLSVFFTKNSSILLMLSIESALG